MLEYIPHSSPISREQGAMVVEKKKPGITFQSILLQQFPLSILSLTLTWNVKKKRTVTIFFQRARNEPSPCCRRALRNGVLFPLSKHKTLSPCSVNVHFYSFSLWHSMNKFTLSLVAKAARPVCPGTSSPGFWVAVGTAKQGHRVLGRARSRLFLPRVRNCIGASLWHTSISYGCWRQQVQTVLVLYCTKPFCLMYSLSYNSRHSALN
jgi:hypothetical protein